MFKPVQLFSVSMYWLWIYDYILTFGDEVRYSSILRQRWQVLTIVQINYAWSGNRSWSEFISTSPRYLIIFMFTQQCLRCSLLYGIPKKTSSCDGLNSIVEQVHSNVAYHLQGRHVFSLHKACKFRSTMLP